MTSKNKRIDPVTDCCLLCMDEGKDVVDLATMKNRLPFSIKESEVEKYTACGMRPVAWFVGGSSIIIDDKNPYLMRDKAGNLKMFYIDNPEIDHISVNWLQKDIFEHFTSHVVIMDPRTAMNEFYKGKRDRVGKLLKDCMLNITNER